MWLSLCLVGIGVLHLMDWRNHGSCRHSKIRTNVKMSGANINRRTKENVEKTGLDIEQNERLFSTIVRSITLSTMV